MQAAGSFRMYLQAKSTLSRGSLAIGVKPNARPRHIKGLAKAPVNHLEILGSGQGSASEKMPMAKDNDISGRGGSEEGTCRH